MYNLEEKFFKVIRYLASRFEKLVIKQPFRNKLKGILDGYGIHRAALFPGLDGLSEYLEWKIKVGK